MKKKLMRAMLLLTLCVALLTVALLLPRMYQSLQKQAFNELGNVTDAAALLLQESESDERAIQLLTTLAKQLEQLRLSWILGDGTVRFDSAFNTINAMESHLDRVEINQAITQGEGTDNRLSRSMGENTYYYAKRLPDGSVLRAARTQRSILAEALSIAPFVLLMVVVVLLLAPILIERFSDKLLEPIRLLDLEQPLIQDSYEELTPLLTRILEQGRSIEEQRRASEANMVQVTAITENMAEGLILLSADGAVLSMNHSAQNILQADKQAFIGQNYLRLLRNMIIQQAVEGALNGNKAVAEMPLRGRIYQLIASPVWVDEHVGGMVLLMLDNTAKSQAETNRREFTANVSHELKTPLTTIAGYGEMMQAGLADEKDTAMLAGKIYGEAKRLLTLIDDIIALSHLDENAPGETMQKVDLYAIAMQTVERMQSIAQRQTINLSLAGEVAYVNGMPTLLEEMVRNLLDNAIRYNQPGGHMWLKVLSQAEGTKLVVEDSGIGIAESHLERIFERFYRVDQSRSRDTGGTGLGLSIVKHAAQVHGAQINVESNVGQGTQIDITFPVIT